MDIERIALELFEQIKKDDVKAFSKLVENNSLHTISYGRFPLLSVLYLYHAYRILKKYERELQNVHNYRKVNEQYEIYNAFKQKAGRSLRLYIKDNAVVSPEEMLAVLGESGRLKKIYATSVVNTKSDNNIRKIYENTHQAQIKEVNGKVQIPRKKMSSKKRIVLSVCVIVAIASIVLTSVGVVKLMERNDDASTDVIVISSGEGLINAITNKSGNIELDSDIDLTSVSYGPLTLSNIIDGKGHTITLNGTLFDKIESSAKLTNVNFVVANVEREINASFAEVVGTNHGIIDNVKVRANGNYTITDGVAEVGQEYADIYVSTFVNENKGTITAVELTVNMTVTNVADDNGYLTSAVNKNYGNITNIKTTSASRLETVKVDVSGLVAENMANGIITASQNNALVSQTTDSGKWFPHASGIVITNSGRIVDSENHGKVFAISTAKTAEVGNNKLSVMASGIVANNEGTIKNTVNYADIYGESEIADVRIAGIAYYNENEITSCKSLGTIIAKSKDKDAYIYLGGVVSINIENANINNCGFEGEINVTHTATESGFVFAGGIIGESSGNLYDSFADTKIIANVANVNALKVGGIIGSLVAKEYNILYNSYTLYGESVGNVYHDEDVMRSSVGTIILGNRLYGASGYGATKVQTHDELVNWEKYWE